MDELHTNDTLHTDEDGDRGSNAVTLDAAIHVIYLIFGILGLLGNGLVLVVMIRVRSLRTITNLFITNQSIIDFMSSAFLLAAFYYPRKIDFAALPDTAWSAILCYFWQSQYIFWSFLGCSTANLMILNLDRYVAVVFPVVYRNRMTIKIAGGIVIMPWIFGFAFQLYWPSSHNLVDGVCYLSYGNKTKQVLLGTLVFIVKLLVPVVTMFLVYYSILRKVRPKPKVGPEIENPLNPVEAPASTGKWQGGAGGSRDDRPDIDALNEFTGSCKSRPAVRNAFELGPPIAGVGGRRFTSMPTNSSHIERAITGNSRFSHRIRINVIKTLLIVTIVFALCWMPNQIWFLLYNLGIYDTSGKPYVSGTPYRVTVVIVFINIWVNPVIYTFKYRRFQDGLRKTFGLPRAPAPAPSPNRISRVRAAGRNVGLRNAHR